MSTQLQLQAIRKKLPPSVELVAVSKFHPPSTIMEAYQAGQRIFGESKVQELVSKYHNLPKDIRWHFIGHLQTNKVKDIVPFVDTIESVDSFRLLDEINHQTAKLDKTVRVLLQIHIAKETSKFGFSYKECRDLLSLEKIKTYSHIQFCGLMGMATFTENEEQIKSEFSGLNHFFQELKKDYFSENQEFNVLSMGMSDDYLIAIEEGSSLIRIGSKIFGTRS